MPQDASKPVTYTASTLHSLVTFRNSQGEAARGTLLKIERSTAVFEVYNPYSIVQLSEVLDGLTVRRSDRIVYQGRAVVRNLVNTGLMLIVSAKLLDPWTGLSSLLRDGDYAEIRNEVDTFVDQWRRANRLRKEFLLSVNRLRSFLGELSRWLGQLDIDLPDPGPDRAGSAAKEILDRLGGPLLLQVEELFRGFEREASRLPEEEVDHHKAFAQRDLHPLLLSAPFVHRTFYKPLGYAGDYEMMNMIQRDPAQGPTIYAKLVNMLFLRAPIPQSVRNRNETLYGYLLCEAGRVRARGECFKVLNVGCGPAIEMQRFVAEAPPDMRSELTLLDFNKTTLDYVTDIFDACVSSAPSEISMRYVHDSVHNLLKLRGGCDTAQPRYDFVYCAGLFDYLSDRICARLLRLFYSWTAPGGAVLVTNMHKSNPNKCTMDHLMEWYLIYRDQDSMANLVPGTGTQRVFLDQTGVNICLEIRKPQTSPS